MGLVNELQESAERDDVQTVLRKAKRVSECVNENETDRVKEFAVRRARRRPQAPAGLFLPRKGSGAWLIRRSVS